MFGVLHCHGLCSPLIPSAEGLDSNVSISTLFGDIVFIILLVSLDLFDFISMSILPAYMYVLTCVLGSCRVQKRILDPLELVLGVFGTGSQN